MNAIKRIYTITTLGLLLLVNTSLPGITVNSDNQIKPALKSVALIGQSKINAVNLLKNDCNQKIRDRLAEIQLGHIAEPLGELVLNRKFLEQRLGDLAHMIELPDRIIVKRQGSILKGDIVSKLIKEHCNPENDKNIEIDVSRIPGNIVLPGNLIDWNLTPNSDNHLGMRLFVLNAKTDGGNFRQLIQVNVARIIQAAQLTRLSKPGEMISSNMINKKRVEVKSEQANLPVSYSDAVGKCLERFKSAGTILRSSDVSDKTTDICAEPAKKRMKHKRRKLAFKGSDRSQWVVNPGDQVKFLFSNGSLALSFPAKAIEGGEIGDHIRLINLKTKKRIQGKITDRGQVEYAKN